jgi:hypothetical protein
MPLDAELESALTELFVVDSPDDADVESDEALLLVDDRPVESEPTPL